MFKNNPFISLLLQDKTGLIGLIILVGPVVLGKPEDPARPGDQKALAGQSPAGQEHRQDEPQEKFNHG